MNNFFKVVGFELNNYFKSKAYILTTAIITVLLVVGICLPSFIDLSGFIPQLATEEKVAEDEYLNNVYVRGEISNFKHHYTGHMYFTLKDEGSLIKCIMFKSSTATLNFTPKDGMKVLVLGTVSVFERDRNIPDICKSNERRWDWGPI